MNHRKLTFRELNGYKITLDLLVTDTFGHAKEIIAERTDNPLAKNARLVFAGEILNDESTFQSIASSLDKAPCVIMYVPQQGQSQVREKPVSKPIPRSFKQKTTPTPTPPPLKGSKSSDIVPKREYIQLLQDMGFERGEAESALIECGNNLDMAPAIILRKRESSTNAPCIESLPTKERQKALRLLKRFPRASPETVANLLQIVNYDEEQAASLLV